MALGMVPLPANKRNLEAYHEVAWLYLLDRRRGDASWIEVALTALSDHLSLDLKEHVLNPDTMVNWTHFMEVVGSATEGEVSRDDFLDRLLELSGITSAKMKTGARMSLDGFCRSDLFLKCQKCGGDRVVIEVKGPQAKFNYSDQKETWQTEDYESVYESGTGRCSCTGLQQVPMFVLLDARGRSKAELERTHEGLDLANWHVIGYGDLLDDSEVEPAAQWLWEALERR